MRGSLIWYWQFMPGKDEGRYCLVIDKIQKNKHHNANRCNIMILYGKEKIWISEEDIEICKQFKHLIEWSKIQYWGGMSQGGEKHLQCICDGFDSHPLQ